MKAVWKGAVIAEASKDELIFIEGNWYFPASSMVHEYLKPNDEHTTCFWKGEASYYNIVVGDSVNESAAWYYATPKDGSTERVGKDFTNYVAFWRGVEITE